MNERIHELAKRAEFEYENYKDMWFLEGLNPSCNEELKRFAELIVRECVGRVRYCIQNDLDYIAEDIEQHLGVKE